MTKITLLLAFIISCYSALAQTSTIFTTTSPIFIAADLNGSYDEVLNTLLSSGLIDEKKNWSAGSAHFVSLGDFSNSDDSSLQIMDLFMQLQKQAVDSGGMFHVLLAEQQIKSLRGEWRHLSNEAISTFSNDETKEQRHNAYQQYLQWNQFEDNNDNLDEFNKIYPHGLFARISAFGTDGKYGSWLAQLPFLVKINDQVFIHGGLSNKISNKIKNGDMDALNAELQTELKDYINSRNYFLQKNTLFFDVPFKKQKAIVTKVEQSPQRQRFLKTYKSLVFSRFGPSWYRGNSLCHSFFEEDSLQQQLTMIKSSRLWVGHSDAKYHSAQSRYSGHLLNMDSRVNHLSSDHPKKYPWIAKIGTDNNVTYLSGLPNKSTFPLSIKDRQFRNPFNMSDQAVENFLLNAKITGKKTTKEGRTKPFKITLEQDGIIIHGIFKYKDSKPNAHKGRWSSSKNNADRYQYEVAAYKLDRMLNIGLVPVTVTREIDGKKGILQVWIEGLITELIMVEDNIPYKGACDLKAQVNMMDTFDYLIANRDRNQTNVMFSKDDWQIWFIDHSRSFSASSRKNKALRKLDINPTPAFKAALQTLTRDQLDSLNSWLHTKQIDAIWKRREKIIKGKI